MAKNAPTPVSSSGSTAASLKEVKAMQRDRRRQIKADAKVDRARKRSAGGPGIITQLKQVYAVTRQHEPRLPLWMGLAFGAALLVGLVIGLLLENWITWLLIALPFGVLAAVIVMNRLGEKAMYSRLEGQTGAAGATLSSLRRGWIVSEQPVAMNPKTQDLVFRAIGRPGVVLVTEGPVQRVGKLLSKEERAMERFLPGVPVHVVQTGRGEGQTPLHEVPKTLKSLPKKLTAQEVAAVDRRLNALGAQRLPIPKGVDPMRARPDRRGLRGRRRVRARVHPRAASHMRSSTVPAARSCIPRPSGPTTTAGRTRHSRAVRTSTRCTGAVRPPTATTWIRHRALPTVVASRLRPTTCIAAKTRRVAMGSPENSTPEIPSAIAQSITRAAARRAAVAIDAGPCSGSPSRSPGHRPPMLPAPGPSIHPPRSWREISGSSPPLGRPAAEGPASRGRSWGSDARCATRPG